MARDFSPEEKLLRLIRSKTQPAPQPAPQKKETQPHPQVPARKTASVRRPFFNIEVFNILLIAVLIGLLAYLVPFILKKPENPVLELEQKAIAEQATGSAEGAKEEARPSYNYFSEGVASKNIFQPILKEEPASVAAPEAEQAKKAEERKLQLSLLGVVWGERPQAIIEDKKAQKTYFLTRGESFDTIQVNEILENKVILTYNGQQFELVL